ncbi:hypothetical protein FOWG_18269, partial [Fusarium oxysporum f. sp. lycopersici MN25]
QLTPEPFEETFFLTEVAGEISRWGGWSERGRSTWARFLGPAPFLPASNSSNNNSDYVRASD